MSQLCKTAIDYGTSNGAMPLLYSIRDCVPLAFDGLLLGIFILIFSGQYFIIKNRTGRAKILVALLSSSIVILVLSMMLALAQLVSYLTVVLYALVTIVVFAVFKISDTG